MALAATANPIPSMSDAYAACMARGRNTRAPWLWNNLRGLWLPNVGIQGERLIDWSGYHNHGTLTNMDPATDWVTTPYGWGLDFDAATNYVGISSDVWNASEGTIAFLADKPIADDFLWDTLGDRFLLFSTLIGGELPLYTGGVLRGTESGASITDDLHLWLVTWPTNILYIDGVLFKDYDDGALGAVGELHLANRYTGSYGLTGRGVMLSIWSRALSAVEIRALAADPFLMIRAQVRNLWTIDQVVVPVADASVVSALVRDEVIADVDEGITASVLDPVTVALRR